MSCSDRQGRVEEEACSSCIAILLLGISPISLSGAYIAAFRMKGVVKPQQAPTERSVSRTLDRRKSLDVTDP